MKLKIEAFFNLHMVKLRLDKELFLEAVESLWDH